MCLEMSRFKDAVATGEIELILKMLAADLFLKQLNIYQYQSLRKDALMLFILKMSLWKTALIDVF